MQTIEIYKNEKNPYVWNNLVKNILELSSLLVHCEYFDEYKKFIIKICKPFSIELGWEVKVDEGKRAFLFKLYSISFRIYMLS